jgi:hypothetical protein
MRGFGAHLALSTNSRHHFCNVVSRGGDFRLLALGNIEPGAGERRLDLRGSHIWCLHDVVPLCSAWSRRRCRRKALLFSPKSRWPDKENRSERVGCLSRSS